VRKVCLDKDCRRFGRTRGLCPLHYRRLLQMIQNGSLTWEQAVKDGHCLMAQEKRVWMDGFVRR
jgi:hypothetical protein